MTSFASILVDVDSSVTDHPALVQALKLAASCSARVKAVEVVPQVPTPARGLLTLELADEIAAKRLERLASAVGDTGGVPVSTELLHGRPAVELTKEVLRSGHDLVLRSHGRDLESSRPRPYGPVDMQLLRVCPCPVWLVAGRPEAHPERPDRILAAVNTNPSEASEQQLNGAILEIGLLLKRLEDAALTVVQVWDAYGDELLKSHMSKQALADLVEGTRETASRDLTAFCDLFGDRLAGVNIELVRGVAAEVIPELVESRGIDLVIMGTVARTGIAGLLIGNTAERVLQRLGGSVLAVKPSGFVSPVRLQA